MRISPLTHGFSLIELMVTLVIISILTTLGVISYHSIENNVHQQSAKQSLFEAAKKYRLYQLVNPYLLNDLSANILFEDNDNYHFQLEQNKKITTFIAVKKHPKNSDPCSKLTLNSQDETKAYGADGQENLSCW
jgi:prepilin-type N-terminal cleavage/methylation domain-containing protein